MNDDEIIAAMAKAYFDRASELGDAVISLDRLNDKARADVLDCFKAAFDVAAPMIVKESML